MSRRLDKKKKKQAQQRQAQQQAAAAEKQLATPAPEETPDEKQLAGVVLVPKTEKEKPAQQTKQEKQPAAAEEKKPEAKPDEVPPAAPKNKTKKAAGKKKKAAPAAAKATDKTPEKEPAAQDKPAEKEPQEKEPQETKQGPEEKAGEEAKNTPEPAAEKPAAAVVQGGKRKKRKAPKKRSVFGIIVASMCKFVFVLVCAGIIAVSVMAVGVSQYMADATANDADLLDLDNLKLNLTTNIWAPNPKNPNAEAEGDYIKYQELTGPQHRIWVDWNDIPQNLKDAIIAIEDREFLNHHGVSFRRSAMAALNLVFPTSETEFGASTIEQQLVKNLTGDDETDYQRKLREMFRAWGMDSRYSKETILEAYLNTISLSGTIAGVQAGAQDYFGKNVQDLDLAQCAMIAGITRAPGKYDPYMNPETCLARRNSVLYQMLLTEAITQEEYDEAKAKPLGVKGRTNTSEGMVINSTFSYFSDAVFNDVVQDLMDQYGYTKEAARYFVYTGGLRIEATVDITLQERMEEIFEHGYDDTEDAFFTNLRDPRSGRLYKDRLGYKEEVEDAEGNTETKLILPQAAMTTIDYSGAVRGVVGGIGEKEGDLQLNRATQSPRQVGSTMKPVAAYALAIDQGLVNYSSMVMDSGVQPANPQKPKRDEETGGIINDWPKNFSSTESKMYRNTAIPVVSAVAESTNTVAVRVGMRVGIDPMFNFLEDTLEITSLVSEDESPVNDKGPSALILGGLTHGISTAELAGAYQIFGNGGRFNSVHTYTQVLDSKGNVILKPEVNHTQAISPEAAYVMNRLLYTVLRSGKAPGVAATANRMALEGEMDSVAKTGTTSDDKDRWFVGLTPYYVTAIWWGYDNPKYTFYNKWSPVATGNIPPLLWKTIMEEQQEGMPVKEFPEKPEGVVEAYYCSVTGERAGGGCPKGGIGYFIPEIRTANVCSWHN
ncbi:transglycosylase domain-containing protein [Ruminococcaceae bacterium OttesenSCG-928-A16]|nr:transglycosylase domain-containing protein [Ruminococcaceae bacterium OttesenSCG-928-A16]